MHISMFSYETLGKTVGFMVALPYGQSLTMTAVVSTFKEHFSVLSRHHLDLVKCLLGIIVAAHIKESFVKLLHQAGV